MTPVQVDQEAALYRPPLPGSTVIAKRPVEWDGVRVGRELLVQGADATQHAQMIAQARPVIAATWRTAPEAVTFHPVADNLRVVVRIIDAGPWLRAQAEREARVRQVHLWPGPTLDPSTGRLWFSVLDTGDKGYLQLWVPGQGGWHTWWLGSTRAGKTGSMSTCLLSATGASPGDPTSDALVAPVVLDGQGGASLGEWDNGRCVYADTIPEVRAALQGVEREMDRRIALLKPMKAKVFDPSPNMPVILVPVDEAPEFTADPEITRIIDRIGRLGAKVLVVLWWATQMARASQAFGQHHGGTSLRAQVKAGNVVLFRTDGSSAATGLDGVIGGIDPGVIPLGVGGACLLYGPSHPVPVLGRALYEPDPYTAVTGAVLASVDWPPPPAVDTPPGAPQPVPAEASVSTVGKGSVDAVTAWLATNPGEQSTGAVVAALTDAGWSARAVKGALGEARDRGLLAKTGHGKWRTA